MPDLKINITTPADLTGARDTGKAIDDLNQKVGEGTDETKKAAEATSEATEKSGSMRLVFTELNRIVPGLGHALHAAFSGPIGPVVFLGMAVAEVMGKLKEYNAELDTVDQAEVADHEAAIGRVKKAWDDAQVSLGKYYAEMATAGEEKDPIKKQLAGIKAVNDAQLEAHKKEIESLGKVEVAWLRAHGGTPDQISSAEARTQSEVAALDSQKQFGGGVGGLEAEQQARLAVNNKLQSEANAAIESERVAKKKKDDADSELAAGRKNITDLTKKVEDATAYLPYSKAIGGEAGREVQQKAQADLDAAKAALSREQERVKQLEDNAHITDRFASQAEIESRRAQDASITNQGRLRELPGEIDQAGKVQTATDEGRRAIDILNTHGGKLNETLGQLAEETGKTNEQTLTIVGKIISHQLSLKTALEQMEQQLTTKIQRAQNTADMNF